MSSQSFSKSICVATAKLLHEERVRRGLSMNALAERAGLSQQMVSYIERDMRIPTLDTLLRIAQALDVPLSSLLRKAEKSVGGK